MFKCQIISESFIYLNNLENHFLPDYELVSQIRQECNVTTTEDSIFEQSWFDRLQSIVKIRVFKKLNNQSLVNFAKANSKYLNELSKYFKDYRMILWSGILTWNEVLDLVKYFNIKMKELSISLTNFNYNSNDLFTNTPNITHLYIDCSNNDIEVICKYLTYINELILNVKEVTNENLIQIANSLKFLKAFKITALETLSIINSGMKYFIENTARFEKFSCLFAMPLENE